MTSPLFEPLIQFGKQLLSFALPNYCITCGNSLSTKDTVSAFCNTCWNKIRCITPPQCLYCGRSLQRASVITCGDCKERTFYYDTIYAAVWYDEFVQHAIHLLKFEKREHLAAPLADIIVKQYPQPPAVDALCPVPLHPRRYRERGFNQAQRIARQLSLRWGIPCITPPVRRALNTEPQSLLKHNERKMNLRNAFAVRGEMIVTPPPARIGLVDDVFTSGETVNECARIMRHIDVSYIAVIVAARAVVV